MAAILDGCVEPRISAFMCPWAISKKAKTSVQTAAIRNDLREEAHLVLAQQVPGGDPQHEEPGQDVGAADRVDELEDRELLGDHREEVRQLGAAVADRVPHRVLHPGVGHEDPERRDVGRDGHQPDRHQVGLGRQLVPPEEPHRDERRLQEERHRRLDRQQRPEDVAHVGRVARPVGPELELEGDPRDHADREVDEEQLPPELRHAPVVLVPGAHPHASP